MTNCCWKKPIMLGIIQISLGTYHQIRQVSSYLPWSRKCLEERVLYLKIQLLTECNKPSNFRQVYCDNKIITKVLNNRIIEILPSIIHYNQTGFIKD